MEPTRSIGVRCRSASGSLSADSVEISESRAAVGVVLLARGRPDRALPLLEQAVDAAGKGTLPPLPRGEMRFALARALAETGGDAARARRLAEQAADDLRAAAAIGATQLATVERWLAAR